MANAAWGTTLQQVRELFAVGTTTGSTDAQLLSRYVATRDGQAFEALVARHGPMVAATCRAILRNDHDAEDAFQATFLVLARKPSSLRAGAALGGWLHRVAYRAAVQLSVQARRRRQEESEAIKMASLSEEQKGLDVSPIVHEEIDRLPDRHRLPIILCDLERLTYEEASTRLGWTLPTLRCRLAKARQRLRDRLTRRGISAAIAVAILSPAVARASVPASWSKTAVAIASGGAAPATSLLISQAVLKRMLMTKMKIAAVAMFTVSALATVGVVAVARTELMRPPRKHITPLAINLPHQPLRVAAALPKLVQRPTKPDEEVEIRGRVISPEGKPVAGATVRTGFYVNERNVASDVISGEGGRFTLRMPKKYVGGLAGNYLPIVPWLVATSPDFGAGENEMPSRSDPHAEQVIRLVTDGPAIQGRVIDLEGRAVADAKVLLTRVWSDPKKDLPGWVAKTRGGAVTGIWRDLTPLQTNVSTKTDATGKFRLTGIGRDRVAELQISGPTIATTEAYAMCRDEPEIRVTDKSMFTAKAFVVYGPTFELAAAPTRPIEGVVRDADSGKPVAGLKIRGMVFDEQSYVPAPGIEAETDESGHYRLTGLGRASAYRLFLNPKAEHPYLTSTLKVNAPSPSAERVPFDFTLKPGVVVEGRVIDKMSSKPAFGSIEAFVFDDNSFRQDYPGALTAYTTQAEIDEDGRFKVATLPGRGLLAVRADDTQFRGAVGCESIKGFDKKYRGFMTTLPRTCIPSGYNAIVEISPDPKSKPAPLTIALDPGLSVDIKIVDPDGKPVVGTKVKGLSEIYTTSPYPIDRSEFTVHALGGSKARRLVVTHEGRKLIGSVALKGDEKSPLTIQMQPWGTIVGRIVDDEGKPQANVSLTSTHGSEQKSPEDSDILPGGDWNGGLVLGNDGRFRVEGLVPGLKYDISANAAMRVFGEVFKGLVVGSGEVKDTGDVKIIPQKDQVGG